VGHTAGRFWIELMRHDEANEILASTQRSTAALSPGALVYSSGFGGRRSI
jgi:hypothetical protein